MPDPLFSFVLHPLEEIEASGIPSAKHLSWFALTDSYYWMNVGDQKLFEYSDDARRHGLPPFADYNVIRLYEDVAEIFPHVLEPVPGDLASIGPSLNGITNDLADDADLRIFDAGDWWWSRSLSSGHLRHGPRIQFVNDGERITLSWNLTREIEAESGLPYWSATAGTFAISVEDFLSEWRSFHNRLMGHMADRIQQASAVMESRGIQLDVAAMQREQDERAIYFDPVPHKTDWHAVRILLREFGLL